MKQKREFSWYLLSKYRAVMYGIAALMICLFHSQVFLTHLPHIPFVPFSTTQQVFQ